MGGATCPLVVPAVHTGGGSEEEVEEEVAVVVVVETLCPMELELGCPALPRPLP